MPSLKITRKVFILVVILACNTVWSVADTNPSSDQHIHIAGSQSVMVVGDEPDADTDSEQRLKAKNIIDRLLQNYTRQNSPHGDKPTTVQLGIYINSFYSISEQTMDYSVNIYLRQEWFDPRLQYNKSEIGRNKDCVKLEDKIWEKLWVPDVFFRNEKKADFHHVTIPNRFINLYPSGKLWYVMKISATLSCMMQLQKYPLDTQICPMMLESFGHTMKTVVFKWLVNKSVESTDELSMPQFVLIGYPTRDCSKNYTTGSYPCLQVDFILRRDIGYFIIQVYIPTVLIVILSWVAFWINTEAIPARVSLGLLTVLTMTTQSSGAGQSLPRVSYIKAIDVWMSVCLIFVFASLLEFAVVNVYSRKDTNEQRRLQLRKQTEQQKLHEQQQQQQQPTVSVLKAARIQDNFYQSSSCCSVSIEPEASTSGFSPMSRADSLNHKCPITNERSAKLTDILSQPQQLSGRIENYSRIPPVVMVSRASKIDKIARRLFPLSFLLFNVIYWVMYAIVK
ncbi:hypothetical protein BOX15_Mlig031804g2 [Macrostomum lignano]|uniref:Uncharacterized protein n=4 Tax=Macrostomum lignano TaxID=282301 RepID=A0A267FLA9_9PLAT|nr:hypothetical protein BOX15_Mlig031804g1 [Macrostomum lignano]PAA73907.1 hypothetical protein BOX15_Mlig031804g2 [Macrostomum lignano]